MVLLFGNISGTIGFVSPASRRSPPVLTTLADRVWFAWHCLPRDARGKPPPITAIEVQAGLSRGSIGRLLRDERKDMRTASLARLAPVMKTTIQWLASAEGEPPHLTGPIFPRDPSTIDWAEAPDESGVIPRALRDEPGEPYSARSAAIIFARANGVDERAVAMVRDAPARDYTAEEWYARIKLTAADMRAPSTIPPPTPPPASPHPPTKRRTEKPPAA